MPTRGTPHAGRAVARWSDPESADDLGALDADAIDAVRDEAWPLVRDADEMHDALLTLACIADSEARQRDGGSTGSRNSPNAAVRRNS